MAGKSAKNSSFKKHKPDLMKNHAQTLSQELNWLKSVLEKRIQLYFKSGETQAGIFDIPLPDLSKDTSAYAQLVQELELDASERLVLILSLAPHVKPELLDIFLIQNPTTNRGYTEFGGRSRGDREGFLPTGETALFMLSGGDLEARFKGAEIFSKKHPLFSQHILEFDEIGNGGIRMRGQLRISEEFLEVLTTGKGFRPSYSSKFPLKPLSTELDWSDLGLNPKLQKELEGILSWIKHEEVLMDDWKLSQHIKAGYKSLFHGPSGTGKNLAAALIGKSTQREIYEVETSLLLARHFRRNNDHIDSFFRTAERNDWILFFDEADSLFGKRTNVRESNARYANQEVSYLRQKIEEYSGIILLSTESKEEIEFPFPLDVSIVFPEPDSRQRLVLWTSIFGGDDKKYQLAKDIDFQELASKYEVNREDIIQVLKYATTATIGRNSTLIEKKDILEGIRRELVQDGKIN